MAMEEENDFNLDDYKPIIDTTTLTDNEIELWYGSKIAVKFLRMIEGCEFIINKTYTEEYVIRYDDLLSYYITNKTILIDFTKIYIQLHNEFDNVINSSIKNILDRYFKYQIDYVVHNNFRTGFIN